MNSFIKELIENHYENGPKFEAAPYANEVIKCLKSKGIKTAILSNTDNPAWSRRILTICGYDPDLFDEIILSCEVGLRKPNPEIFKLAQSKFD